MTFRYADRVRITNLAPATGNFTDQNAATGYGLFGSVPGIVNSDTVPYVAWDGGANWELGHLTYNAGSPATLSRTVLRNSLGNTSVINFAGTVYIWCGLLAEDIAIGTPTGDGAPVLQHSPTLTGNALLNQTSSAYTSVAASTATTQIDLSLTPFYYVTMGASTTFSFINCPNNSGYAFQFFMFMLQDATGGRTPTFPASCHFPGGTAPTPTTTANKGDLYALTTFNGGTSFIVTLVAPNVSA